MSERCVAESTLEPGAEMPGFCSAKGAAAFAGGPAGGGGREGAQLGRARQHSGRSGLSASRHRGNRRRGGAAPLEEKEEMSSNIVVEPTPGRHGARVRQS